MTTVESPPAGHGDVIAWATAQGRLQQSIASTLLVIAAARAERAAPPIHAARQHLAAVYGATRLRRRLESEAVAAEKSPRPSSGRGRVDQEASGPVGWPPAAAWASSAFWR